MALWLTDSYNHHLAKNVYRLQAYYFYMQCNPDYYIFGFCRFHKIFITILVTTVNSCNLIITTQPRYYGLMLVVFVKARTSRAPDLILLFSI